MKGEGFKRSFLRVFYDVDRVFYEVLLRTCDGHCTVHGGSLESTAVDTGVGMDHGWLLKKWPSYRRRLNSPSIAYIILGTSPPAEAFLVSTYSRVGIDRLEGPLGLMEDRREEKEATSIELAMRMLIHHGCSFHMHAALMWFLLSSPQIFFSPKIS